MEADKQVDVNVRIAEYKKRILLAEGQKAANEAEWNKQNGINCETISTLKKEIKELTQKCGQLRNPLQTSVVVKELPNSDQESNGQPRKASASTALVVGRAHFPMGARNVDDAIFLTDLKVTENRKQLDLVRHRFKCRKEHYIKLMEQLRDLKSSKEAMAHNMGEKPPETLEEDANRKLVCQLENEIHRTNVQWMEAEHIRKKYRSIEASLMNDAERFERSLRELENSLSEQQAEIDRLQQVHTEAISMRDAAKVILLKQEQQANISRRTRERQALDYRKQVELRKMELERIGRKLFTEGKPALVQQDSIVSSTGDPHTAHTQPDTDDPDAQLENATAFMDNIFKNLMEVTGATSPQEVLERFSSQKESAERLNYLRKAAEAEKQQLEQQRDALTQELEASKFSDVKESEVNQEVIEKIKNNLVELQSERDKYLEATNKTLKVLQYLKERLAELIYKLQEVDERSIELPHTHKIIRVQSLGVYLHEEADEIEIIEILKMKIRQCEELLTRQDTDLSPAENEAALEDELMLQLEPPKSPSVPDSEKPQPMPMCYFNLLTGRGQRAAGTSSSSPEQTAPAAAATEEESEVPTRNFFKRQSALIVESKSRRKPFRPVPDAGARRK